VSSSIPSAPINASSTKFPIADLPRQMDLAAPDEQQRRDQATALIARLAQDRFSAARRSTAFAGRSTFG
jgi:hypothetical protein